MQLLDLRVIGELSERLIPRAKAALEESLPLEVRRGEDLEIPKGAFNSKRSQYKASLFLALLKSKTTGLALGITNVDLYGGGLNFVFGQAQPGRAAMVSMCRLDPGFYGNLADQDLLQERLQKECLHEVGHVLRLGHCSDPSCVMSFSNSILEVDRKEANFCERCKSKLFEQ